MSNSFKNYTAKSVTTEEVILTGATDTQTTVIGFSIANTTDDGITVSALLNDVYLVEDAPITTGSSLVVIGGDQKLVVEESDTVSVISSDSADVIISVLEITD